MSRIREQLKRNGRKVSWCPRLWRRASALDSRACRSRVRSPPGIPLGFKFPRGPSTEAMPCAIPATLNKIGPIRYRIDQSSNPSTVDPARSIVGAEAEPLTPHTLSLIPTNGRDGTLHPGKADILLFMIEITRLQAMEERNGYKPECEQG